MLVLCQHTVKKRKPQAAPRVSPVASVVDNKNKKARTRATTEKQEAPTDVTAPGPSQLAGSYPSSQEETYEHTSQNS